MSTPNSSIEYICNVSFNILTFNILFISQYTVAMLLNVFWSLLLSFANVTSENLSDSVEKISFKFNGNRE